MVGATSDFDQWLQSASSCVATLNLKQALHMVSYLALRDYCARIWFVEIYGPRRSFFAGHVPGVPLDQEMQFIKLEFRFGMVCGSLGKLKLSELDPLIAFVSDLFAERIRNYSGKNGPSGFQGVQTIS